MRSHDGNAFRALTDAVAFNDAIKAAMAKVEHRRDTDRGHGRP